MFIEQCKFDLDGLVLVSGLDGNNKHSKFQIAGTRQSAQALFEFFRSLNCPQPGELRIKVSLKSKPEEVLPKKFLADKKVKQFSTLSMTVSAKDKNTWRLESSDSTAHITVGAPVFPELQKCFEMWAAPGGGDFYYSPELNANSERTVNQRRGMREECIFFF